MAWRNNKTKTATLNTVQPGAEIILFDTETTGLNCTKERIIEIAAIKYEVNNDFSLKQKDILHEYIKPPFLIPQNIVDLTGITNEKLASCPYEEDVFEKIHNFFTDQPYCICCHNTPFDIGFVKALFERNGCKFEPKNELDTLEMARDLIPKGEIVNHKLATLANAYGLDEGVEFHSAIEDVKVTALLFEIFVKEYLEKKDAVTANLIKVRIKRISYWQGYKGFSRIYIETDAGTVFYDIRQKIWDGKDCDVSTIDMDKLEEDAFAAIKVSDINEFARFKGTITM